MSLAYPSRLAPMSINSSSFAPIWCADGMRVRQSGMGSGRNDGIERGFLGAQHFHLEFDLGGDIQFADARAGCA